MLTRIFEKLVNFLIERFLSEPTVHALPFPLNVLHKKKNFRARKLPLDVSEIYYGPVKVLTLANSGLVGTRKFSARNP